MANKNNDDVLELFRVAYGDKALDEVIKEAAVEVVMGLTKVAYGTSVVGNVYGDSVVGNVYGDRNNNQHQSKLESTWEEFQKSRHAPIPGYPVLNVEPMDHSFYSQPATVKDIGAAIKNKSTAVGNEIATAHGIAWQRAKDDVMSLINGKSKDNGAADVSMGYRGGDERANLINRAQERSESEQMARVQALADKEKADADTAANQVKMDRANADAAAASAAQAKADQLKYKADHANESEFKTRVNNVVQKFNPNNEESMQNLKEKAYELGNKGLDFAGEHEYAAAGAGATGLLGAGLIGRGLLKAITKKKLPKEVLAAISEEVMEELVKEASY